MEKANLSHTTAEQPRTLGKQWIVKEVVDLKFDGGERNQILKRP